MDMSSSSTMNVTGSSSMMNVTGSSSNVRKPKTRKGKGKLQKRVASRKSSRLSDAGASDTASNINYSPARSDSIASYAHGSPNSDLIESRRRVERSPAASPSELNTDAPEVVDNNENEANPSFTTMQPIHEDILDEPLVTTYPLSPVHNTVPLDPVLATPDNITEDQLNAPKSQDDVERQTYHILNRDPLQASISLRASPPRDTIDILHEDRNNERVRANNDDSERGEPKRRRLSNDLNIDPPATLPKHLLKLSRFHQDVRNGNNFLEGHMIRTICQCVVSIANAGETAEKNHAMNILVALLSERSVSPNCSDSKILKYCGGTPLHLAIELESPDAVEILLNHGASLSTSWKNNTPIQLAYLRNSSCWHVIENRIRNVEAALVR